MERVLVLALIVAVIACAEVLADPSIDLVGAVWSKKTLRVAIAKPAWLSPNFVDAVKKAFEAWDRALEAFGRAYGYEYLADISFKVTVTCCLAGDYDIFVTFTDEPARPDGEIGRCEVLYGDGKLAQARITLYVKTTRGPLKPVDVFNIALHEIGHALGLVHSSSSKTINGPELMYPYYTFPGLELRPSTLDAYALAVAYSWMRIGVFKPPSTKKVTLPPAIPYKMLLYYYVRVKSAYGAVHGEGWYVEGAKVKVYVENETVALGPGVRAVFKGWRGTYSSESPVLEFRVYGDVELEAEWGIQYWVEIVSPYGRAEPRSGWYDEGTLLEVRVANLTVDHGNGTRRVFSGWTGSLETANSTVTLRVNAPIKLRAVWRTEYWVEIESKYSKPTLKPGWYAKGAVIAPGVEDAIVPLNSTARVVFVGWRSSFGLVKPGEKVVINTTLKLEARWQLQYWVEVNAGYGNATLASGWYPAGSELEITASPLVIEQRNGTRRVFKAWLINGAAFTRPKVLVRLKRPLRAIALWKTQYLITLGIVSMDGYNVSGYIILSGPQKVNVSVGKVWLDKGSWRIVKAVLRRVEKARKPPLIEVTRYEMCTVESANPVLTVSKPDNATIVVKAVMASVEVVDALGLPAPLMTISMRGPIGGTWLSDLDGVAFKGLVPLGKYLVTIKLFGVKVVEK